MSSSEVGSEAGWETTTAGILVPAASQPKPDDVIAKPPLSDPVRSTAWATWATAAIAVIALVVSALSVVSQGRADRREADHERRLNASRVQIWNTEDSVVIQNSSIMPISAVYLNWVDGRGAKLKDGQIYAKTMLVAYTALPPCSRWTFSTSSPEIKEAKKTSSLIGITFVQDGGVWSSDWLLGILEGPSMDLLDRPHFGLYEWRDAYAKSDAASTCSA